MEILAQKMAGTAETPTQHVSLHLFQNSLSSAWYMYTSRGCIQRILPMQCKINILHQYNFRFFLDNYCLITWLCTIWHCRPSQGKTIYLSKKTVHCFVITAIKTSVLCAKYICNKWRQPFLIKTIRDVIKTNWFPKDKYNKQTGTEPGFFIQINNLHQGSQCLGKRR